jgi:hypothetical protein
VKLGETVVGSQPIQVGSDQGVETLERPLTSAPMEDAMAASILPDRASAPTSVYKYYDHIGVLIYVGITAQGVGRQRQHNADKAWWPFVAEQAVEHFATREEAECREVELIRHFRPPVNTVHNKHHMDIKRAYAELVQKSNGTRLADRANLVPKRWIYLHHVAHQASAWFLSELCDAAVATRITKFARANVIASTLGGQIIGRITSIEPTESVTRFETNAAAPPGRTIHSARARISWKGKFTKDATFRVHYIEVRLS